MRKKFLCSLLIFTLLISTTSLVLAENGNDGISNPDGLTIQAVHQTFQEDTTEYPMVLELTNNTGKAVTVTGKITIWAKSWPGASEKTSEEFNLFGDVEEITIDDGATKEIVEVPSGGTDTWRAFYHPKIVSDMDIVINVKAEGNEESQEMTFMGIDYAIAGTISNPLYVGEIKATDNEDGTATLRFNLTAFQEYHKIVCNGNGCYIESLEPEKKGPKTGLKKSDFSVQREGQILGEIIQAKEIAEGEYELIWQYKVGTHQGLINAATGYGDLFVTTFSKDNNGDYDFNDDASRNDVFEATITQTKDPVVIEHEDATFETVGATNIPKIVNLFFKEIDEEEFDEDLMDTIKENVKRVTNGDIVHTYDIKLLLDGVEIQPNGSIKITIPLTEKMKNYVDLKIVYISETGEVVEVEAYEITDDAISFITSHFSYYAVIGTPKIAADLTEGVPRTGDFALHYVLFINIMALAAMLIIFKRKYSKQKI